MDFRRRQRQLLPLLNNVLSGFYSPCPSRQKERLFRVEKGEQQAVGSQRTRNLRPRRRHWLAFKLSSSDHHASHNNDCFIDHLCDLMKVYTRMADSKDELRLLAKQYREHQNEIVELTAEVAVHTDRSGIALGTLEPVKESYQEKCHRLGARQVEIYNQEIKTREERERLNVHANGIKEHLYESGHRFYQLVRDELRPRPQFLSWDFVTQISLLHACATQISTARDRLNCAVQEGLDLNARSLLLRNIEGLRADLLERDEQFFWRTDLRYDLGNRTDLVYLTTEDNLDKLQAHLGRPLDNTNASRDEEDGDSESELSLADSQPPDFSSKRQEEDDIEWPDVINGVNAPRAELANDISMIQLAGTIFDLNQVVEARQEELTSLREKYFFSLSRTYLNLSAVGRERCDEGRELQGAPPFLEEEARLERALLESREELQVARQAMRSYIDTKRVPTEDTFREQTNDLNSDHDAAGLKLIQARQANPQAVRRWQARIAREAIPSADGTLLPPRFSGNLLDMDSVHFSEELSNGNGSDYSVEIVDRKVKWLHRNEVIVAQKRQYLESQGVVFQSDDVAQH